MGKELGVQVQKQVVRLGVQVPEQKLTNPDQEKKQEGMQKEQEGKEKTQKGKKKEQERMQKGQVRLLLEQGRIQGDRNKIPLSRIEYSEFKTINYRLQKVAAHQCPNLFCKPEAWYINRSYRYETYADRRID